MLDIWLNSPLVCQHICLFINVYMYNDSILNCLKILKLQCLTHCIAGKTNSANSQIIFSSVSKPTGNLILPEALSENLVFTPLNCKQICFSCSINLDTYNKNFKDKHKSNHPLQLNNFSKQRQQPITHINQTKNTTNQKKKRE